MRKNIFIFMSVAIIVSASFLFMGKSDELSGKKVLLQSKVSIQKENGLGTTLKLPSLQRIEPDDPYLLLPLEYVSFQLTFTQEVDPAVIEQAVSFEPELDFIVQNYNKSGEVFLQPQEKLQSDKIYTLQIKGVQNEVTGKQEILKFTYRTDFYSDRQIINPQWSHDGEEIVYLVRPQDSDTAQLWKVGIKGGNEQLLASGLFWPGKANWSPDDNSILFTKMVTHSNKNYADPEVRLVDRKGQKEEVVVPAADLEAMVGFGPSNIHTWWSPDGKKIALQLDLGGVDAHSDLNRSMAVVDSGGKGLHPVTGQIFAGWQDDQRLMVLKTYQNYNHSRAYRYDLLLVDAAGKEPVSLLLGEGQIPNFDRASQSSDHNTLVISQWKSLSTVSGFKEEGVGFLLYDKKQNSLIPFGLDDGYQKHPAVSPQGEKIAFAANKAGNWNLYLWENGTTKQLTSDPTHELYPVWSPGGDKLAFVSTRSGTEGIWLLDLLSGKVEQLTGKE